MRSNHHTTIRRRVGAEDEEASNLLIKKRIRKRKRSLPIEWMMAFVLLIGFICFSCAFVYLKTQKTFVHDKDCLEISDKSALEHKQPNVFSREAIVTENDDCSEIGKSTLSIGGSAVDAAIASAICLGVVSMNGAGIGGGSFILIHDRESKENLVIDSRETAPLLSSTRMFDRGYKYSIMGGLSIAVPGEIAGYWDAHQRFGVLPWKQLFEPTIELCTKGFRVSRTLAINIKLEKHNILRNNELRQLLGKNTTGADLIQEGDYMKNLKLAETLRVIADEGPNAFYNGSLTDDIVNEIQSAGGIITREDLQGYKVRRRAPLVFKLRGNHTLITVPPPAGGSILGFVLKAMQDFTLTEEELSLPYAVGTFYHRLAESMKFAFSRKERLSDPDFIGQTTDCRDISSELFLSYTVAKIDEEQTHPIHYYGLLPWSDEHVTLEGGTAHLNILTNSYAVSMTTSINNGFGSKVIGKQTGIVYNNHMHEFWTDFKTCSSNLVHPLRRPISFISPAIVLDPNADVELVIGGAGGAFIPVAIAQVIIRILWFRDPLKFAIDNRRIAHLLMPDMLMCERGFDQKVLAVLAEKGHRIFCFDSYLSGVYTAVQAIQVTHEHGQQKVVAYSDPRKGGSCAGT